MQIPDIDAGVDRTTAHTAIEMAQEDIVTAFVKRRAASK
jgi:hypothetical protein